MPTSPVAALSLILGFAVADVTGVRPLGGLVLAAAAVWCAVKWRERAGFGPAVALLALYALAFAGSHALGDAIGAWPAVFAVAAAVGAAAYVVADAPRARTA